MNLAAVQQERVANRTVAPAAPLQIELRFRVKLPPTEVFDLLALRLGEWFTAVHGITWNHSKSVRGANLLGACSERVCDFGGKSLVEKIVEFEPGRRYAYRVDMARSQMKMPLRDHYGSFEVEPVPGGSTVTWRQHFTARWFVPTAMLRWQLRDKMTRPAVDVLIEKHGGEWISVR